MAVLVEDYEHRTGEHCASTALRNVLQHAGLSLSEPMVFGLASGVGFYYFRNPEWSPTRMFHGRTESLEGDFFRNTGIPFEQPSPSDDARAWADLQAKIDAGIPVMIATDTFYLSYQGTTSHFPGHQAVVVGYEPDGERVFIADRKLEEFQVCTREELRRARNAPDYPMRCQNRFLDIPARVELEQPRVLAIRNALEQTCRAMLAPEDASIAGIGGMQTLAADFASWRDLADWSWAARFGYQVVIKRGAGGSFFRSLYADFLEEAAEFLPALAAEGMPERMHAIAARWRDLAAVLKEQSERESCDPALFDAAGARVAEIAVAEAAFFGDLGELARASVA